MYHYAFYFFLLYTHGLDVSAKCIKNPNRIFLCTVSDAIGQGHIYNEEITAFATKLASFSILSVTPTTECFILIMSALDGDAEVGLAVCDFINECLSKRTQALSENSEREILLRPEITITHSGRHSCRPAILDL